MEACKNMNKNSISPTGGVLIISLPSRGVSWVSPGKTLKSEETQMGGFKLSKHVHNTSNGTETWNVPSEDREQQLVNPLTQQICHISAEVEEVWRNTPLARMHRDIQLIKIEKSDNHQFNQIQLGAQRFDYKLREHFMYICEQAGIRPDRCSFSWQPTTSTK